MGSARRRERACHCSVAYAPDAPVDGHAGDDERAKEVYVKLDDVESLLGLYVRKQDWDAALKLAEDPNGTFSEETRAKFDEALYLPYAEWLAVHDKFDEALEAYRKSGREDRAARMMQQLTFNAVVESRFKDFLEVDDASQKVVAIQNKEGCYFPVLSAFTSTPSLVKSCVDPDYESPVPSDCYDCISGCLGDTTRGALRLDCGSASVA